MAVITISLTGVLTAVGTFVESRYNQEIAGKLVYDSLFMKAVLSLMALCLMMVLIDRWPWKKRHTGFVLAHIGILILMLGFLFSGQFGVDGSLRFAEGEKKSLVSVQKMEIKVYSSYDGEKFSLIYEEPVDLFLKRPTEKKPYLIQTAGERFIVDKHWPFAVGREDFKQVSTGNSPALRFHLSGSQASAVEWMRLSEGRESLSQAFGPAQIHFTKNGKYKSQGERELVLFVEGNQLFYSLGGKKKKSLKVGDTFSTGWMDFQFRLLEFFPKSQREFIFEKRDRPSDKTVKALRVRHQEEAVWLGQNSYIQFFKEDRVYALAYLNKTYNLDFDLELLDFRIAKYQGTDKAKSYESEVRLNDEIRVISMNEPLKHKGWIFYQSSFEPGEDGKEPVVSILSVNRDPGRFLKYLGSFLVVLGAVILFYHRKIKKIK